MTRHDRPPIPELPTLDSGVTLLVAVDAETGEERWAVGVDSLVGEDISVAADGTRVLAVDRSGAGFTVVDEGEVIWSELHSVGPN